MPYDIPSSKRDLSTKAYALIYNEYCQNRIDRENYVVIQYDNIKPDKIDNFQQQLNDSIDLGPYNYDSIMHYYAYAFSSNGEKTIVSLKGHRLGQRGGGPR